MAKFYSSENYRPGYKLIICRYVTRNGKRIYPKKGKYIRFWAKDDNYHTPAA